MWERISYEVREEGRRCGGVDHRRRGVAGLSGSGSVGR